MSVSSRNTKAEILSAYSRLEKQLKQLQESKTTAATPREEGEPGRDVDIDALTLSLRALQKDVGDAVSVYQNDLATEMSEVQDLQSQLNKEVADLAALHEITLNGGSTLGKLVTEYDNTQTSVEDELAIEQEKLDEHLQELRASWDKEIRDHEASIEQAKQQREQDLQRQNAEYEYSRSQILAADKDKDEQTQKENEGALTAIKEGFEEKWAARDKQLSEEEERIQQMRQERDELAVKLEKANKAATAEGENIAKKQAKYQAELVQADILASEKAQDIELSTLAGEIQHNEALTDRLTKRLESLTTSNQKLASEALEARHKGSTQALEAVERLATEVARNKK